MAGGPLSPRPNPGKSAPVHREPLENTAPAEREATWRAGPLAWFRLLAWPGLAWPRLASPWPRLGRPWPPPGFPLALLGLPWAFLWASLGPPLGIPWAPLGSPEPPLGVSWPSFGLPLARLSHPWALLGSPLGPCGLLGCLLDSIWLLSASPWPALDQKWSSKVGKFIKNKTPLDLARGGGKIHFGS